MTKVKIPNWLLLVIIISGHIHAIFFYGGTFWVDSEAYIYLAKIFEVGEGKAVIFDDPKLWIYSSHMPLGEPFIWFCIKNLPVFLIWPSLVLIQHGCGILAQSYFFTTLNRLGGNILLLIPCIIMSFFPFYQAMHNALMTEAISGASIVVSITATLRLAYAPRKRDFVYFGLASLGGNFRTYLVLISFVSLSWLWLSKKIAFRKLFQLGVVCIFASTLSFTILTLKTGSVWYPRLGVNSMWQYSVFVTSVPAAAKEYVESLSWPDHNVKNRIFNGEFSREDVVNTSIHWGKNNINREQAMAISEKIGALLLDQPNIWKKRTVASLVCMGVPEALLLFNSDWIPRRIPAVENYKHQLRSLRYFSWVERSQAEYEILTKPPLYAATIDHDVQLKALRPYLNFFISSFSRNFLSLSLKAPGIWALLGVLALCYLAQRRNVALVLFFLLQLSALFTSFWLAFIPSIRYMYAPVLLYLMLLSVAMVSSNLPPSRLASVR